MRTDDIGLDEFAGVDITERNLFQRSSVKHKVCATKCPTEFIPVADVRKDIGRTKGGEKFSLEIEEF